jgi:hypothetical protein
LRGPKVEELYSEMLRDMAHACKLNQQSQDQASPVNVPIDEFNCKELGLLDMTLNTNHTFKLNVSVEERLLESFSSDKDYEYEILQCATHVVCLRHSALSRESRSRRPSENEILEISRSPHQDILKKQRKIFRFSAKIICSVCPAQIIY